MAHMGSSAGAKRAYMALAWHMRRGLTFNGLFGMHGVVKYRLGSVAQSTYRGRYGRQPGDYEGCKELKRHLNRQLLEEMEKHCSWILLVTYVCQNIICVELF